MDGQCFIFCIVQDFHMGIVGHIYSCSYLISACRIQVQVLPVHPDLHGIGFIGSASRIQSADIFLGVRIRVHCLHINRTLFIFAGLTDFFGIRNRSGLVDYFGIRNVGIIPLSGRQAFPSAIGESNFPFLSNRRRCAGSSEPLRNTHHAGKILFFGITGIIQFIGQLVQNSTDLIPVSRAVGILESRLYPFTSGYKGDG